MNKAVSSLSRNDLVMSPSFGFEGTSTQNLMMQTLNVSPGGTLADGAQVPPASADPARRSVKLPSTVPEQQRGERPYYHECYFKYCTTTLAMRESAMVVEDLINGSVAFYNKVAELHSPAGGGPVSAPLYEGTPPFGLTFSWNELCQVDACKPPKVLRNASAWDERLLLIKKFQESISQTCEQAVFAAQRLFKGRQQVPSDLIAVENTTSFISTAFGALIHVWFSETEAKKFMTSQNVVAQSLASLRLASVATPTTVMFTMHTVAVTATPLMPLVQAKRATLDGPQIVRQIKQLEVLSRARCPFQVHSGADGRWYVVDTLPVLRAESESQGETNNNARFVIFDVFPNMDDFPDTLRKAGRKVIDAVVDALLEGITAHADTVGGMQATKVHDLIAARVLPKACHGSGFKMSYAYDLLEHPKIAGAAPAGASTTSALTAIAKELICAEMVCRTFKEMIRSEVATIKTVPHSDAPTAAVSQFVVEVTNRCVFNLLTKEDLWAPHALAVLRIKFNTPEHFVISQHAVTKRSVLGYLTSKLGLVFEGGRYCRTSLVLGASSVVTAPNEARLVVRGQNAEAITFVQSEWHRSLALSNPDLLLAYARQQLHRFALCASSSDVEMCISAIDTKMEERSCDLSTRGDMMATYLDALLEVLPGAGGAAVCRRLCTEYVKKYSKLFLQKEQDIPIVVDRLLAVMRAIELLPVAPSGSAALSRTLSSGTLETPSLQGGSVSSTEERAEIRLVALDGFRRIVLQEHQQDFTTSQISNNGTVSATTSGWLHPLLLTDAHVALLCDGLDQLYVKEGQSHACSEMVGQVLQARSSRGRCESIAFRLQRCVVRSIQHWDALPPNQRTLYRDTAHSIWALHQQLYTEAALPSFVALQGFIAHELALSRGAMSMRQSIDLDNFAKTISPVLALYTEGDDEATTIALAGAMDTQPQHPVWQRLKSEEVLTAVASAIILLMDVAQWGLVKNMVAFTHHVVCEGKVDGYARLTHPAHSCLNEVAVTMKAALAAVAKFQWHAKRSMSTKKEDRARALEARSKREASGFTRSALAGRTELPLSLVVHAAKECHDVCLRIDNKVVPPLRPLLAAPEFNATTLVGVRALLACAAPKSTSALSSIVVQSGYFPPFKYSVVPFAYGHRHIVIVPDTQCIGSYWSRVWMAPAAKFFESNTLLYAKIAAQYIYSQLRFTHLFFSIVGFGLAGPIAECLMQLIPAADAQVLITLGAPAAFSNPRGLPVACATGHITIEEDLTPFLVGLTSMPHIRNRLIGRMEGIGGILPLPPTKRQMQAVALYGHHHHLSLPNTNASSTNNVVVVRDNGASKELMTEPMFFKQGIDLRRQFIGVGTLHYVDALMALSKTPEGKDALQGDGPIGTAQSIFSVAMAVGDAKHRTNTAVASLQRPWFPVEIPLLQQELSPDGSPSDKLRSTLVVPSSVEPNVLQPELMLLTYPKVTQRIWKGVLTLNDEYGFDNDGQTTLSAIERVIKCRTMEQLVYVLQSYVAASWFAEYLAMQLVEWSGVDQGLHRQPLSRGLVENVILKHSFLFTMCPETSKASESGTVMDRITKHYTEDAKATFAGPLGYHVGWSIALCKTLPSVETGRVLQALLSASCQGGGIGDVHARTGKNLFAPAIRFTWSPPPAKVGGGAGARGGGGAMTRQLQPSTSSVSTSSMSLVQWNLLDVTFDGSNASQTLMRCAEQCVWVVQDEYSFQHFTDTVDISGDDVRQYIVFCPRGELTAEESFVAAEEDQPADQQTGLPQVPPHQQGGKGPATVKGTSSTLVMKIKAFADAHSTPFYELHPSQPESVSGLIAALMRELSSFIRVPVNPSVLPKGVHVGGLYKHDDDEVNRTVRKGMAYYIKPATPTSGGRTEEDRAMRRGLGGNVASNHVATVLSLKPTATSGGRAKR